MKIRMYHPSDCEELTALFYQTVHTINARDYTKEQLDAWAPPEADLTKWNQSLQAHFSVVAVGNGSIIGFGDMAPSGYLDRLYVHAEKQGEGIATAICDLLEQAVPGCLETHASITARPFFERRGYRVIQEQSVERRGVLLTNFLMRKER